MLLFKGKYVWIGYHYSQMFIGVREDWINDCWTIGLVGLMICIPKETIWKLTGRLKKGSQW